MDTHKLERRSRPRHGDARVLVTGRIGFRHPTGRFAGIRVGIYLDLRNPPRWRRPWRDHYSRSLELCAEAERLGADSVWCSEHHLFKEDGGYLPQPLTFLAAVATRTSRVRLGTALVLAPLRPPAQIAEEAAIVDLLSGGRLELGVGAGYRIPEFTAYGRTSLASQTPKRA